jgi:ribosomal subunit interface protein
MKINLQTLKFKPKEELVQFVNEKVGKLSRFDDKIISAEVTLTADSANVPENKICDIRLIVPGNDDFVKKNAATFEEAIQTCVDILQKVLQRKKDQAAK